MRSADTSPEAHAVQLSIHRAMSPGQRLAIGVELSKEALSVLRAGIETRHPDYSDEEVTWALRRVQVGDRLFRNAWPHAPLLTP